MMRNLVNIIRANYSITICQSPKTIYIPGVPLAVVSFKGCDGEDYTYDVSSSGAYALVTPNPKDNAKVTVKLTPNVKTEFASPRTVS